VASEEDILTSGELKSRREAGGIQLENKGLPETRAGSTRWPELVRLVRPHQWTKNLFCFAGVLFGPGRLTQLHSWYLAFLTFAIFVACSSSVYILNDLLDRERDRKHPKKRNRPLAKGTVSVPVAIILAVSLAAISLAGAARLDVDVFGCLILYVLNNAAYSKWLKNIALLDVLSIACGFVLRLLAGVYALHDLPTAWIVLCSFFLALFLALAKRRAELASYHDTEMNRRPVLLKYSVPFLDHLLNDASIMAIMCYVLFTTTAHKNPSLVLTVPVVFFAIMHYKRLVMLLRTGEEPDIVVIRDVPIIVSTVLWLGGYLFIIWGDFQLFR
jgi:4-hydroxybenzoate polyprenyltransferase